MVTQNLSSRSLTVSRFTMLPLCPCRSPTQRSLCERNGSLCDLLPRHHDLLRSDRDRLFHYAYHPRNESLHLQPRRADLQIPHSRLCLRLCNRFNVTLRLPPSISRSSLQHTLYIPFGLMDLLQPNEYRKHDSWRILQLQVSLLWRGLFASRLPDFWPSEDHHRRFLHDHPSYDFAFLL